jgi:ketosteroid isomerase-like protein
MSRENVELVRASLAAWSAGQMDAFRDLHDPNVTILRFIEDWPDPAPVAGRDAVVDFYDGVRTGDDASAEPITEFLEAAGTVAIRVLWRTSSQGHDMGMEVTVVYTVRRGKIAAIEFFRDHAEALEAVGLRE